MNKRELEEAAEGRTVATDDEATWSCEPQLSNANTCARLLLYSSRNIDEVQTVHDTQHLSGEPFQHTLHHHRIRLFL